MKYINKKVIYSEDPEVNWKVIQDFIVTLWVIGLAEDSDIRGVDIDIMDCRPEARRR